MTIYLVRHAKAGSRLAGYQDKFRPLTSEGKAQANRVATFLANADIKSIITSPAVRCQQTVEPLATKLSIPVLDSDVLWEDSLPSAIVDLMNQPEEASSVLCSHGNLIPAVVQILRTAGATAEHGGIAKASIWSIEGEPHNWQTASYLSNDELP